MEARHNEEGLLICICIIYAHAQYCELRVRYKKVKNYQNSEQYTNTADLVMINMIGMVTR